MPTKQNEILLAVETGYGLATYSQVDIERAIAAKLIERVEVLRLTDKGVSRLAHAGLDKPSMRRML